MKCVPMHPHTAAQDRPLCIACMPLCMPKTRTVHPHGTRTTRTKTHGNPIPTPHAHAHHPLRVCAVCG